MSCGMVRKVDELGRVVIPKEMRRVLNIKTGSSIEMFINDRNEVVLKKFSEISNIYFYAESLIDLIFDRYNFPCLISDDDKIILSKGVNKRDYNGKKVIFGAINDNYIKYDKGFECGEIQFNSICYIFPIVCDGFECGYLIVLTDKVLDIETINSLSMLIKYVSSLIKF